MFRTSATAAGAGPAESRLPPVWITLALALPIHLWLWRFSTADMAAYLVPWLEHILARGPVAAFAEPFSNYTPPYLYLLALVSPLAPLVGKVTAIKLLSVAGTAALALAVHHLLRTMAAPRPARAAALMLLMPSAMLNAALMGQCDAIYAAACVMAVSMAAARRHGAMLAWCGLAFAFKAQAVLIAPFFLAIVLQRRVPLHLWLLAPLAAMAAMLPAWLAGWPAADLATIYLRQADTFVDIARNAPNLWSLVKEMPVPSSAPLNGLAVALAAGASLAIVARLAVEPLKGAMLLRMAVLAPLLTAGLLPQMHERYFFLADAVALAYAATARTGDAVRVAVLVQTGSMFAILGYLGMGPLAVAAGAGLMIVATLTLALPLWRLRPAAAMVAATD